MKVLELYQAVKPSIRYAYDMRHDRKRTVLLSRSICRSVTKLSMPMAVRTNAKTSTTPANPENAAPTTK